MCTDSTWREDRVAVSGDRSRSARPLLSPAHSGGLEWKGEERSNDSVLRVKGGGKRGVRSEGGGDGVVAAGRRGERAHQSRTPEVETPVDLMPTWWEVEGGGAGSKGGGSDAGASVMVD